MDVITQGVLLRNSIVRGIGNVVRGRKRNMSRCCLPGTRVNGLIDGIRNSNTVEKDDMVKCGLVATRLESHRCGI